MYRYVKNKLTVHNIFHHIRMVPTYKESY